MKSLNELKCAFPSGYKHFLIQPIKLSNCGHSVCKPCIQKDKIKTIKCDMCSKESELNIAKSQLSKDIQELIEKNFLDILKVLETENKDKLKLLRSIPIIIIDRIPFIISLDVYCSKY